LVVDYGGKVKIMTAWLQGWVTGKSYEELNYTIALKKLGHKVYSFDVFPDESSDDKLLQSVNIIKPDILLIKFYRDEIAKETVKYISEHTKTTVVGIFGDDEKYFYKNGGKLRKDSAIVTSEYAPCVNYSVTTYLPAIEWYKKIGIPEDKILHMYYCAEPKIYKKLNMKQDYDISFSGTITPERVRIFKHLSVNDIRVHVFGNGWGDRCTQSNNSSILEIDNYVRLFSKTKVNLQINVDIIDRKRILQIKAREYEVTMCGGFLLTHYNKLLEPCFEFGKEIETYETDKELVDKIHYYLKNDSKRELIAKAGHKRARRDHTSVVRFRKLLKQIKLKGNK
jgi:spore maturation protein CgeB